MALTVELEGKTIAFAWPEGLFDYPRKYGFKRSDFNIASLDDCLHAADENPQSPERAAMELLKLTLVEMAGRDTARKHKEVGGVKQFTYREITRPNGTSRKVAEPVWEMRTRYGNTAEEGTTRLPNSVNSPAAYIRDKILDWQYFKDLAPRLNFLEDEPNPGVTLHPNDEATWKKAHADAISNKSPRRKAALELLALVKSGKYDMWDGVK